MCPSDLSDVGAGGGCGGGGGLRRPRTDCQDGNLALFISSGPENKFMAYCGRDVCGTVHGDLESKAGGPGEHSPCTKESKARRGQTHGVVGYEGGGDDPDHNRKD